MGKQIQQVAPHTPIVGVQDERFLVRERPGPDAAILELKVHKLVWCLNGNLSIPFALSRVCPRGGVQNERKKRRR
jgi:hypothetical protein